MLIDMTIKVQFEMYHGEGIVEYGLTDIISSFDMSSRHSVLFCFIKSTVHYSRVMLV
jgi:hypothetical protein